MQASDNGGGSFSSDFGRCSGFANWSSPGGCLGERFEMIINDVTLVSQNSNLHGKSTRLY